MIGVEPSTVEQFLYFIYTGEIMGTIENEELLKLADKYKLTTLTSLCRVALEKIQLMQFADLMMIVNDKAEIPSQIWPDKDTEIFFDRTTPTFQCILSFDLIENETLRRCVMQYQNEDFCFAYLIGPRTFTNRPPCVADPMIHCLWAYHYFGLKVEDIYFRSRDQWLKMESKNLQENAKLIHFTKQKPFRYSQNEHVCFDIKIVSTIGNYYYEMMDDAWMKDFWSAATTEKLTDVEIFVGTVKVMEGHRVILSARSPVLKVSLNKISNAGKSIVTFNAEYDVDIVKIFLKFLYTGLLETSPNHKDLLALATIYQVETLKNICQLPNRVLNTDDLINCLLYQ